MPIDDIRCQLTGTLGTKIQEINSNLQSAPVSDGVLINAISQRARDPMLKFQF